MYALINKEALNKGGYPFKSELECFVSMLGLEEGYGEVNVAGDL